jgi:hypothetical protein|uniref:Uncharacterized protein n=1 Tax=viral metagenome TaxID=1070528 RepID=A0A6C0LF77_9ZZZZ
MDNKNFEDVLNQYVEILMYDINIKSLELKKNKLDVEKSDLIFKNYYQTKINEFKTNIDNARKIYLRRS